MSGSSVGKLVIWSVLAEEFLSAIYDLRWMIIFCVVLIVTDFWWGWRECKHHREKAKTDDEKKSYKFRFSTAGRRTLNKLVDYTTYLLLGSIAGLAITEPLGVCTHTTSAALGLGFGCLFELSSIVGHIAQVRGVNIKLNLKGFLVALVKKKSEDLGEILDQGIEEIEDNRQKKEE